MSNRKESRGHRCPVAAFQNLISGKYKLRIMWDLEGATRLGDTG
jgi:DNA-binding HxlR family transcriptional regulator